MKPIVCRGEALSFSQKLVRLGGRLRDPQWRKFGATLLGGKIAGLACTLLIMSAVTGLFFAKVMAADVTVKAADVINPINTAWTLIAAVLVFGMQGGFTMLEAGFCRSRETVNVLMECIVDTCLCGILFYAILRLAAPRLPVLYSRPHYQPCVGLCFDRAQAEGA